MRTISEHFGAPEGQSPYGQNSARAIVGCLFCILFVFLNSILGVSEDSKVTRKLIIFYSPTCHKCIQAKNEVMPKIEKEFKDRLIIEYRDITDIDNYKLMLGLKEKYEPGLKVILPIFFIEGRLLNGQARLKDGLKEFIIQSVSTTQDRDLAQIDLIAHFKTFKPWAVISSGLIDGINPCAFTVIVFFISFLGLQGYKKRELVVIGLSFILAVFLTYLLLGLGLFSFLYRLKGFQLVVELFNLSVGVFSIALGLFCLYDFFRFKKTKETEGLILQLPKSVKNRINRIIGLHYRIDRRQPEGSLKKPVLSLFFSALITGFLVSILEAICTGQVYLPTIAFVLKTTHLKLEALSYLLLYNLMFILPLLIIFLFALWGVTSEQFAKFLKQHLLSVKVLMAILFFGLGIFLLWRV